MDGLDRLQVESLYLLQGCWETKFADVPAVTVQGRSVTLHGEGKSMSLSLLPRAGSFWELDGWRLSRLCEDEALWKKPGFADGVWSRSPPTAAEEGSVDDRGRGEEQRAIDATPNRKRARAPEGSRCPAAPRQQAPREPLPSSRKEPRRRVNRRVAAREPAPRHRWREAVKAARQELNIIGMRPIKKGTPFYDKIIEMYERDNPGAALGSGGA